MIMSGIRSAQERPMTGNMTRVVADRRFGFIKGDHGTDYFFHRQEVGGRHWASSRKPSDQPPGDGGRAALRTRQIVAAVRRSCVNLTMPAKALAGPPPQTTARKTPTRRYRSRSLACNPLM